MAPLLKKLAEITVPVSSLIMAGEPLVAGLDVPLTSYSQLLSICGAEWTEDKKSKEQTVLQAISLNVEVAATEGSVDRWMSKFARAKFQSEYLLLFWVEILA